MPFRSLFTLAAVALCTSSLVWGGRLTIRDGPVLGNNFRYCSPTGGSVIVCEPTDLADVAGVSFYVNDANMGWVAAAPYTYSTPASLTSAKVGCVVIGRGGGWKETIEATGVFGCSNTIPPVMKKASPEPVAANRQLCVTMPALSYTNSIKNNHWTEDGKALVYRTDINNPHRVWPPGSDPLVYKFTVPIRSHYAITMDSETAEVTDFNDCWLKFTNGITLRKVVDGVQWPLRVGLTGSVKAYQNSARRLKAAYSVDGRYHSFETTNILEPGTEYEFIVEGRSPQFKFFGIIMFPCKDATCWHETPHHEAYRWTCNV